MKKIKLLAPILGLTSIATIAIPLTSCGGGSQETTKYTVTIQAGEGGSVSATSLQVNKGSTWGSVKNQVTATPDSGYKFKEWQKDGTTLEDGFVINANITAKAIFEKDDQGTVITKQEFKTLSGQIKTNFINDTDHKYFTKDEIEVTFNSKPLALNYVSETDDYGRNVLIRYDNDGSGKSIAITDVCEYIEQIEQFATIVSETYTKYNDSVKIEMVYSYNGLNETTQGSIDAQIYNNGFIKYYHLAEKPEGHPDFVENIDVTYKAVPHSIDTFAWEKSSVYVGAYLVKDKQYTISFTPEKDNIKSFTMDVGGQTQLFSVDGEGILDWKIVGAAYTGDTALTKGQKYTFKVHIDESKYLFLHFQ